MTAPFSVVARRAWSDEEEDWPEMKASDLFDPEAMEQPQSQELTSVRAAIMDEPPEVLGTSDLGITPEELLGKAPTSLAAPTNLPPAEIGLSPEELLSTGKRLAAAETVPPPEVLAQPVPPTAAPPIPQAAGPSVLDRLGSIRVPLVPGPAGPLAPTAPLSEVAQGAGVGLLWAGQIGARILRGIVQFALRIPENAAKFNAAERGRPPPPEPTEYQKLLDKALSEPSAPEQWVDHVTQRKSAEILREGGVNAQIAYETAAGIAKGAWDTALTLALAGVTKLPTAQPEEAVAAVRSLPPGWFARYVKATEMALKQSLPEAAKFGGMVYVTTPGPDSERAQAMLDAAKLVVIPAFAAGFPTALTAKVASTAIFLGLTTIPELKDSYEQAQLLAEQNGGTAEGWLAKTILPGAIIQIIFGTASHSVPADIRAHLKQEAQGIPPEMMRAMDVFARRYASREPQELAERADTLAAARAASAEAEELRTLTRSEQERIRATKREQPQGGFLDANAPEALQYLARQLSLPDADIAKMPKADRQRLLDNPQELQAESTRILARKQTAEIRRKKAETLRAGQTEADRKAALEVLDVAMRNIERANAPMPDERIEGMLKENDGAIDNVRESDRIGKWFYYKGGPVKVAGTIDLSRGQPGKPVTVQAVIVRKVAGGWRLEGRVALDKLGHVMNPVVETTGAPESARALFERDEQQAADHPIRLYQNMLRAYEQGGLSPEGEARDYYRLMNLREKFQQVEGEDVPHPPKAEDLSGIRLPGKPPAPEAPKLKPPELMTPEKPPVAPTPSPIDRATARREVQKKIEKGQNVTDDELRPFAGEPLADDAQKQNRRHPSALNTLPTTDSYAKARDAVDSYVKSLGMTHTVDPRSNEARRSLIAHGEAWLAQPEDETWSVRYDAIRRAAFESDAERGIPGNVRTEKREAPVEAQAVRVPDTDTFVKPGWRAGDASELVESTDPGYPAEEGYQNRNTNAQYIALNVEKIASKPDANSLLDNPIANNGSPIVDANNNVMVGNTRVKAIREIYRRGGSNAEKLDARYREFAKNKGIPIPAGVKNLVIWREVAVKDGKIGGSDMPVAEFIRLCNKSETKGMTEAEQAVTNAKTVREILGRGIPYRTNDEGDPLASANMPFLAAFTVARNEPGLLTSDGRPTLALRSAIERAILATIFPDEKLVATIIERSTGEEGIGIERQKKAILAAADSILHTVDAEGYSIVPVLSAAVEEYANFRSDPNSSKLSEYILQRNNDMFKPPLRAEEELLLGMLEKYKKSARRFSAILDYYRMMVPDTETQLLPGVEVEFPSIAELLKKAEARTNEDFAGGQPATEQQDIFQRPSGTPQPSEKVLDVAERIQADIPPVNAVDAAAQEAAGGPASVESGKFGSRPGWETIQPEVKEFILETARAVAEQAGRKDNAALRTALLDQFGGDVGTVTKLEPYFSEAWEQLKREQAKKEKPNEPIPTAPPGTQAGPGPAGAVGEPLVGPTRTFTDEQGTQTVGRRDKRGVRNSATAETFVSGAGRANIPLENVKQSLADAGHILRAYDNLTGEPYERFLVDRKLASFPTAPRTLLLGYETGTGKTFMGATIAREIMDRAEAKGTKARILWITTNRTLQEQVKRDTEPYKIGDVVFGTYADMRDHYSGEGKPLKGKYSGAWDFVFFDEAHMMKNTGTLSFQAGNELLNQAVFSVFSSATPFENPGEAAYLANTGIFDKYPAGPEDAPYTAWARAYGVDKLGRWQPDVATAVRAHEWLRDAGVLVEQKASLPEGLVRADLVKHPIERVEAERLAAIDDAFRSAIKDCEKDPRPGAARAASLLRAQHKLLYRRALESFKVLDLVEMMNEDIRAADAKGEKRKWVVMTATKSERDVEDNLRRMEEEMRGTTFHEYYADAHRNMIASGFDMNFPSVIGELKAAFEEAGLKPEIFTGSVDEASREKAIANFKSGKGRVLIATMDAGGVGLSVHDEIGEQPITHYILTAPWTGTKLSQAVGRTARYGMKSAVVQVYLFKNLDFEQSLADRVGTRLASMKATVNGAFRTSTAEQMRAFDFGLYDPMQATEERPGLSEAGRMTRPGREGRRGPPPVPDPWRYIPPEDKEMRDIAERVVKDKKNRIGPRTITDALADYFLAKFIVEKSQTTKASPANWAEDLWTIRTRAPNSEINLHELGHTLYSWMEHYDPQFVDSIATRLTAQTDELLHPESRASASNHREGMAEWFRKYIVKPDQIGDDVLTAQVETWLSRNRPEWLQKIRGAAIAWKTLLDKGPSATHDAVNNDIRIDPPSRWDKDNKDLAFYAITKGAPLDDLPAQYEKILLRLREVTGTTKRQCVDRLTKFYDFTKDTASDLQNAYFGITHAKALEGNALVGNGLWLPSFASRAGSAPWHDAIWDPVLDKLLGPDRPRPQPYGKLIKISDSVEKLLDPVPPGERHAFLRYGQLKAELDRYWRKGHEFPAMDLHDPVAYEIDIARSERGHPEWRKAFLGIQQMMGRALYTAVMSKQITIDEFVKTLGYVATKDEMGNIVLTPTNPRPGSDTVYYWPLFRVEEREQQGIGTGGGVHTRPGQYLPRARGSQMPLQDAIESFGQRIRTAIDGYVWRNFFDAIRSHQRDAALVMGTDPVSRAMIRQTVTELKPDLRLLGKITPGDDAKLVSALIEHIKDGGLTKAAERAVERLTQRLETVTTEKTRRKIQDRIDELQAEIAAAPDYSWLTPDSLNLSFVDTPLWRQVKPNAVNVIAYEEQGRYRFFQMGDPAVFDIFAKAPELNKWIKMLVDSGATEAAKAAREKLTSSPWFSFRNIPRDARTSVILTAGEGLGPISWASGGFATVGLIKTIMGEDFYKHIPIESQRAASAFLDLARRPRTPLSDYLKEYFKDIKLDAQTQPAKTVTGLTLEGFRWGARKGYGASYLWNNAFSWVYRMLGSKYLSNLGEALTRRGAATAAEWQGQTEWSQLRAAAVASGYFENRPADPNIQAAQSFYGGFWNAKAQILRATYQKMTHPDPRVRREVAARIALVAGTTAAFIVAFNYAAMGAFSRAVGGTGSEEERKKRLKAYFDRPLSDRLRYMSFFGLKLPFDDFPLGSVECAIVYAMDEYMKTKFVEGGPQSVSEHAIRVMKSLTASAGNPLMDLGGMVFGLGGFDIRTYFEMLFNRSFWTQKEIVPDYLRKAVDPHDMIWDSTPEGYVWLNQHLPANPHPLMIQHFVMQAFGRDIDEAFKLVDTLNGTRPITEKADTPFIGQILSREGKGWFSQPVQDARDLWNRYDVAKKTLEMYRDQRVNPSDPEYMKAARQIAMLEHTRSAYEKMTRAAKDLREAQKIFRYEGRRPNPDRQYMARLLTKIGKSKQDMTDAAQLVVTIEQREEDRAGNP